MHKKIISITSLTLVIIFLFSSNICAFISTGTVGIMKFETVLVGLFVSYDNGSTYRTVFDGTSTAVDIAAPNSASNSIGTFMSGISLPVGTITHMKVRVRTTLVTKGWVLSGGTYYYTENTQADLTGETGDPNVVAANWDEVTITPPSGSGIGEYYEDTAAVSGGGIVVTEGGTVNISIVFPPALLTVVSTPGGTVLIPADISPTITQI